MDIPQEQTSLVTLQVMAPSSPLLFLVDRQDWFDYLVSDMRALLFREAMSDLDRFMVALTCRRYLAEIRKLLKFNQKQKKAVIWQPYVRHRCKKIDQCKSLLSRNEIASEIGAKGYASIWNFFLDELQELHFFDQTYLVVSNALSYAQRPIVSLLGVSAGKKNDCVRLEFRGLKVEFNSFFASSFLGKSGELRFINEMMDRIRQFTPIEYADVCDGASERGHWNILKLYFLTAKKGSNEGKQEDRATRILCCLLANGHSDCARKLFRKGWVTIDKKAVNSSCFSINIQHLPYIRAKDPRYHMERIRFVEELGVRPLEFEYLYSALRHYDAETIRYLNDKYDAISSCDLGRLKTLQRLLRPTVILEFATILKQVNPIAFYQWAPSLYYSPVADALIQCVQYGMREDVSFDGHAEMIEFLESNSIAYPHKSHPFAPKISPLEPSEDRIVFKTSSQFEKLIGLLMKHDAVLGMGLMENIAINAIDPSEVGEFMANISAFIPQREYLIIIRALCSRKDGKEKILQQLRQSI